MHLPCRHALPALLLFGLTFADAGSQGAAAPKPSTNSGSLRNGVYAVLKEAPTPTQAQVQGVAHAILVYDKKHSDLDQHEPPKHVAIDTSSFVPLVLAQPPDARTDENGRTLLWVRLAQEHVKTLEDLTRAHLGGLVAIVIDGEIITMHKVRTVIQGGEVQITRCRDSACQILRAKLAK